ncbi:interleukin-12 receptor subunit beta-1 [Megalops cyprinoides]|uniref:interleukin-12 receptor subunit beta-1 n=1 Tax=Megalops cyprinoides TaxID=118141 RepID=UPI0018647162|nr:interleukin-12 receptor subunit beta-1 [Megalops cyprinoides]
MSRSSGKLTLTWKKPLGEVNGVVNEIQFRGLGDQWKSKTFETAGGEDKLDTFELLIQDGIVYEVRIRRRAIHLEPYIWSAWSQTKKVPTEIHEPPKVNWTVGKLDNYVRLLNLTWEAPPRPASAGGVNYSLSLSIPCQKRPKTIRNVNTTEYITNVTASDVNVTVIAVNNAGKSPTAHVTIPAEHLLDCPKDKASPPDQMNVRKVCVEWYKLQDGVNGSPLGHRSVFINITDTIREIKEGCEDFVRYHYFVHTKGKQKSRTIALCPMYKREGVPTHGPQNVTVDVTYNSAIVSWEPIPIKDQQGFLRHYVIDIKSELYTKQVKVEWFQTNCTIQNLPARTRYTVHVAGETATGVGPNVTVHISLPQGLSDSEWIIIGILVVVLVLTILCSVIIKRFKSKLLPEIPTPVITETPIPCSRNNEESYPFEEELHAVTLLQPQQDVCNKSPPGVEESSLLEARETTLCEDEGEESQTDSDDFQFNFPMSPDYKRQMLSLPAPLESVELTSEQASCEVTTPVYRNGLVFELKTEDTSDKETEL